MHVLGISCHYHDSAACLVSDGKLVAAAQEERFTRQKYTADFPLRAINFCLQEGGIAPLDVDHVAFYERPYLKFARVLIDHVRCFPASLPNFLRTMPEWLGERLSLPVMVDKTLGATKPVTHVKHHLSHAASAFLVSPFDQAAIMTIDGVGEWATLTYGAGQGRDIAITKELHYPHSLGLLYTALTVYLGFDANGGEGKVMGLAAYGKPSYRDAFRDVVEIKPDGSFQLNDSYFGFNRGRSMYSRKFVKRFGPPRQRGGPLEQRHYDLATTLQAVTEEILIAIARTVQRETGQKNLCMAGGVALNCLANHRILEETPFERIFVQPAAGDAGGALGAAVCVAVALEPERPRPVLEHAFLGPSFSAAAMRRALLQAGLEPREHTDEELFGWVADRLVAGQVVGWYQGRLEFGPRALGNRSILGDARHPKMKDFLNERVKHRESFRPFAPVVHADKSRDYFEVLDESPFMTLAPRVRADKLDVIPAAIHVDGTARLQTVRREQNPRYWQVIDAFGARTGVYVILNTSLNLQGEPIACAPEDAVADFQNSEMDVLVLGNYSVERQRTGQPAGVNR